MSKVRIHYGYGVGTDIAIVDVSEIQSYIKRFSILSIEDIRHEPRAYSETERNKLINIS